MDDLLRSIAAEAQRRGAAQRRSMLFLENPVAGLLAGPASATEPAAALTPPKYSRAARFSSLFPETSA
jgi:hypothetical protein